MGRGGMAVTSDGMMCGYSHWIRRVPVHGEWLGAIADGGQQDRLEAYEQDQREARRDLGARHAAHGRGRGPSPGGGGRRRREEPQAAR